MSWPFSYEHDSDEDWEPTPDDYSVLNEVTSEYEVEAGSAGRRVSHSSTTRVIPVEEIVESSLLRRQSLESHPEARPERPATHCYTPPSELEAAIERIEVEADRIRVPNMLRGYFLDLHLVLAEACRVLKPNAHAAFVVGNARYMGVALEVDTYLARIGQALGLLVEHIYIARRRGNSAQQMGKHGRDPQRESVVVFRAPGCTDVDATTC